METNNIIKRIHPYTFCIICKGSNDYYIVGNDIIIYSYLSFEKAKTKVKSKSKAKGKNNYNKKNIQTKIDYTKSSIKINEKKAYYLKKELGKRNIEYICIDSRLSYIVTEHKKYENNNMYSNYLFKAKLFNKRYMNLRKLILELEERNYSINILKIIMGIVAKRQLHRQ